MDSASLNLFTPVLDGIDRWAQLAPLLPVIVVLELILSADNAVALASISRKLRNISLQRKALNIGISISLILRIILLLTANIVIKYTIIRVIASIYLFYLVIYYFVQKKDQSISDKNVTTEDDNHNTLISTILLLSITDLAFSIDSITTAVAISDQILVVIIGTLVGVIALRFTADFFVKWLEIYVNLESAGYLAVGLVAVKLIIETVFRTNDITDYSFYFILIIIFIWGFYTKKETS
ncbi:MULTISPECIES: DUF475 domain-containing protein [Prochlorococcus]|uniref:DUF475 domain-containing protein n=1 Tax=Prochlorococcus TaxID=1218 RepID=UPI0005338593|nr:MULTISPECIES: DUF475 domain-containing protein [Prochlorococcus]KGG12421.1 Conserved membrane protein TerC [Prochlorococcus sp. MIT 0601]